MPREERAEVRRIFRDYGLRGPALEQATDAVTRTAMRGSAS
jgi:hypothetical protein